MEFFSDFFLSCCLGLFEVLSLKATGINFLRLSQLLNLAHIFCFSPHMLFKKYWDEIHAFNVCNSVVFSIFTACTAITTNSRTFASPQKETFCMHEQSPPYPWKLWIDFLFPWICLFWKFHVEGIIQYGAFGVWLLSLATFTHVVEYSVFHSFVRLNNIPLYGCTTCCAPCFVISGYSWVVSTSGC